MVLDDARLASLDAARFGAVLRPKLAGALALDRATADDPIELFVMFSSLSTAHAGAVHTVLESGSFAVVPVAGTTPCSANTSAPTGGSAWCWRSRRSR